MTHSETHKMYFFAILCPPELDKKILQFKFWMKEHFGAVVALKSPVHITLIQPFWLEESREENLLNALQLFRTDLDEMEIQLDGFSFFGKRTLFIRVQENPPLAELKQQVENHFNRNFGDAIKKDDRPFHPHLTIANRDLKPGDFEKAWQHFEKKEFNKKFSSRKLSLLRLNEAVWNVIEEKQW